MKNNNNSSGAPSRNHAENYSTDEDQLSAHMLMDDDYSSNDDNKNNNNNNHADVEDNGERGGDHSGGTPRLHATDIIYPNSRSRLRLSSHDGVTQHRSLLSSNGADDNNEGISDIERIFSMRYRGSSLHRQEEINSYFIGGQYQPEGKNERDSKAIDQRGSRARAKSDGDALLMIHHLNRSTSEETSEDFPRFAHGYYPRIRPSYMQTLLLKQKLRQKLVLENVAEQQQEDDENQVVVESEDDLPPFTDTTDIGQDDSEMSISNKETGSIHQQQDSQIPSPVLVSPASTRSTMMFGRQASPFISLPTVFSTASQSTGNFHVTGSEVSSIVRHAPSRATMTEDLRELVVEVQKEPELHELSSKLREIHALIAEYIPERDRQKLTSIAMMHMRQASTGTTLAFPTTSTKAIAAAASTYAGNSPFPLEVRLEKVSCRVKSSPHVSHNRRASEMINKANGGGETETSDQMSSWSKMQSWLKDAMQFIVSESTDVAQAANLTLPQNDKYILKDINLVIEPGQQYLVVGPPSSGKTTLLKAISGILDTSDSLEMNGTITFNGKTLHECNHNPDKSRGDTKRFYIENAFAYIDQLDQHAALLTVRETLSFAWRCKTAGRVPNGASFHAETGGKGHRSDSDTPFGYDEDSASYLEEVAVLADQAVEHELPLKVVLTILGLVGAENTFLGDPIRGIQGISGGQRRRVTVGEMITGQVPCLLGDEISNGLDSSSTYDLVESLLHFGRLQNYSRVISLLQPSPEVVALFDQVIVISEGQIIYAGPVDEVEDYFASLGFRSPDFLDISDFLQLVSTDDRESLYDQELNGSPCPTIKQLAEHFLYESTQGEDIRLSLSNPHDLQLDPNGSAVTVPREADGEKVINTFDAIKTKYALSFWGQMCLLTKRFLLLWVRDKKALRFSVVRNIVNGASVGGAFLNASESQSIQGALFQTGIFVLLGSLQTINGLVQERSIFDKQYHANFFSPGAYVLAKTVSLIPQTFLLDTLVSGATLYYMVGLGGRTSFGNFFVYSFILFTFATTVNQQIALFASFASEAKLQLYAALFLFFNILFGGFIIPVLSIPKFWLFAYYWNPFQWAYTAFLVNEAYSGRYDDPRGILETTGVVTPSGAVLSKYSIWWSIFYLWIYFLVCSVLTSFGLSIASKTRMAKTGDHRSQTYKNATDRIPDDKTEVDSDKIGKNIKEIKSVTLSFQDISYEVKASTSNERLLLLNNISGVFRPGRMTALMGSSGAGKTTLLDCIALRKRTGKIVGDVFLNGWPQEETSFRRCSGYVEQFDLLSPELTVLETVLFSARLRLDPLHVKTDEEKIQFCRAVLNAVELNNLEGRKVGNAGNGGLTFEQKKRLSIAVELAAAPSILFLDEPTTGLDSRSALLIVRLLRQICTQSERTIVATIHQPSSAVFDLFDDLLLLRTGGEVTYMGPLGKDSRMMISYFESLGARPIELGDNPANWVLRVLQGAADGCMCSGDLVERFKQSDECKEITNTINRIRSNAKEEERIQYESVFATGFVTRQFQVVKRLHTLYWRSPTYSAGRIVVSLILAMFLGSVFVPERKDHVYSESDIRARISIIFLSNIVIGILAMISVQPVMTRIRDVFYRQRDACMYDSLSLGVALGSAELPYIASSSALFCLVFLSTSGISRGFVRLLGFWGFFTFNSALFSYYGQLLVVVIGSAKAAMTLSGLYIGVNVMFSGLVIPPQTMVGTLYAAPYYITPGHYVFEGEIMSVMSNDDRTVEATPGSEFYDYLVGQGVCDENSIDQSLSSNTAVALCVGSQSEYVAWFFGGEFNTEHTGRNIGILVTFLVVGRFGTWLALKYIRSS